MKFRINDYINDYKNKNDIYLPPPVLLDMYEKRKGTKSFIVTQQNIGLTIIRITRK